MQIIKIIFKYIAQKRTLLDSNTGFKESEKGWRESDFENRKRVKADLKVNSRISLKPGPLDTLPQPLHPTAAKERAQLCFHPCIRSFYLFFFW